MKHGCLIASLLPLVHALAFAAIVAAFGPTETPTTWGGWFGVIGFGAGFGLFYLLTLLLLLPVLLVLSLKDRDALGFIRNNWPILVALSYPFWGGWVVPGPFDEIIVGGVGLALQVWFVAQRFTLARQLGSSLPEEQRRLLERTASQSEHQLPDRPE